MPHRTQPITRTYPNNAIYFIILDTLNKSYDRTHKVLMMISLCSVNSPRHLINFYSRLPQFSPATRDNRRICSVRTISKAIRITVFQLTLWFIVSRMWQADPSSSATRACCLPCAGRTGSPSRVAAAARSGLSNILCRRLNIADN